MAASTPYLRTGWSVSSAASSGERTASSRLASPRRALYSGSERPAWRMNQTGVCGTGSLRHARRNGASETSTSRPYPGDPDSSPAVSRGRDGLAGDTGTVKSPQQRATACVCLASAQPMGYEMGHG